MSKIQEINTLKENIKNTLAGFEPGQKEDLPRLYTDKALAVIESEIKTQQDALLYFASLNYLNSYVKEHKKEISYFFKSKVIPTIDKIIENGIEGVVFGYNEKEKCTLVNVGGLQFTFHGTKLSDLQTAATQEGDVNHSYYTTETWEGLRLQPVAKTLFTFAEKLEGLTIDTESLLDDENEL